MADVAYLGPPPIGAPAAFANPALPSPIPGRDIPTLDTTTPLRFVGGSFVQQKPAPQVGNDLAPRAVTDILAQHDPAFDAFWARMLPGESGGKDLPNYRYDATHTASGDAQITDTNWKAWAPKLGIDVSRFPTAMSAPPDYQKAVTKLMHRAMGSTPWDAAHGGSLPVGGEALHQMMGAAGKESELYSKAAGEMRSAREDALKILGGLDKDSPDFEKRVREATGRVDRAVDEFHNAITAKPEVPTNQALEHFGGIATIAGMLAGMFARQPLMGMLNAAGAAVGAANQKDWDSYKAHLETWKTQSEMLLRISELQQQRLKSVMDDRRATMADRLAKAKALMDANGMSYLATELEAKGPDAMMKALDTWQRANEQAQYHRDMLDLRLMSLGMRAGVGGAGLLDKDTLSTMADQYIAGDKSVLQGLGYGNMGAQNRAALRTEISRKMMDRSLAEFRDKNGHDPNEAERQQISSDIGRKLALSIAEFGGLQQAERTGYGRVAQLTIGAQEAKQFTPLALAASKSVERTEYPTLNKAILAVNEGTGDTNVINFVEANIALVDAYAQVIGRGNAQLTDAARSQAMGLLNTGWSQDQYETAVKAINREIEAALKAPGEMLETFREGFGVGGKGLPDLSLNPKSGGSAASLPSDLPSPAGHVDGTTAKDDSGHVVAVIKDGKWTHP